MISNKIRKNKLVPMALSHNFYFLS